MAIARARRLPIVWGTLMSFFGWVILTALVLFAFGCGVACGEIAARKGYNRGLFMVLGFFFLVITAAVVLALPKKKYASITDSDSDFEFRP
jgi:hypothetical protein